MAGAYRIPYWEKPPPLAPPKSRNGKIPSSNAIAETEIVQVRGMPERLGNAHNRTQREKDAWVVRSKLNKYFGTHHDESMLVWFSLWKCKNGSEAQRVISWMRTGPMSQEHYAYLARGAYIYFTKFPHGEPDTWTEAQQEAYREYLEEKKRVGNGKQKGTTRHQVWHCENGHEWIAPIRVQNCPHSYQGRPCPGMALKGNAPDGTLNVTNAPIRKSR